MPSLTGADGTTTMSRGGNPGPLRLTPRPRTRRQEGNAVQTPPPFGYERATSVEHAVALLEQLGPEARLVAGGHSLLPMMKLRLARPEHLVDVNGLAAELGYIRVEGDELC